ncbi:DUF6134 family protein [Maribacter sp. 2307ULW6-5]|uniref:DUF6134 family protein n=1 Tax=Maribacter sp. 2307ULW6-5 TaxID=3386275 RepID=UPI0039BC6847
MIRHLILVIFLILLDGNSDPKDSSLYFDIVVKNKVVGSLKASQITKGSKTTYQSFTSIKTHIIKDIKVNYEYDVTFDNFLLQKADVHITVNDKPHAETSTLRNNAGYKIVKNQKESSLDESIEYATILLYFKEPAKISSCYSEQDGTMNTIVSMGNNSYKKINAKGKENSYYYKNGVLQKAIIDGGIVNFEMNARE